MSEAADEIDRLRAQLNNLGNAAAIVYAAFKPVSGPDETATALLVMELGLCSSSSAIGAAPTNTLEKLGGGE